MTQGSTFEAIGSRELRELCVFAPEQRLEQQRIAEILETLDDQICATQQIIVKFELVAKGLLEELMAIHGPAGSPNAWNHVTFGELMTDIHYGTSRPSNDNELGVPVLRIPNIQRGYLDLSDLRYQQPSWSDRDRYGVVSDDLLLVRTNGNPALLGRCACVENADEFLFASYLIRIRVDAQAILPMFANFYLRSTAARSYIESRASTSAGNYNINTSQLREMPVALPALEKQEAIVQMLRAADQRAAEHISCLNKLRSLKQGLMSDVLTGRVRVPAEGVS